ncbi:MAG: insulinase family protein, partial [Bacteroidales bacterium]|nr:insulinase family protein [Bacteroidales bacterium]
KLAMPILGTKKSVRALSRKKETALRFMQQNYTPDKMVVFVQGNLHATQVFEYIGHVFAITRLSPVNQPFYSRSTPVKMTAETRTYKKHTHQVHVMMGGRAYPIGHKKQLALYLLNNILGGGSMSSRLNLSLREKRGLVYSIESQYTPLSDSGYWSIYFASDAKDKDECIRLIHKELDKLRQQPLTDKQMQRALRQLYGQMAISAENQENNVLAMAKLMLYHNTAPTWQETFKQIEQLQASDLLETAQEIFTEDNLSVLTYE